MSGIVIDWLGGLDLLPIGLIGLAGLWAGAINTVVGSGTLVTFPVLIALGYPPVTASMSNVMGLVAGNVSGAWGYRFELAGVGPQVLRLLPASLLGGILGVVLLLNLPSAIFGLLAPSLMVVALILVVSQPRLQRWVVARQQPRAGVTVDRQAVAEQAGHRVLLTFLVFLVGVYGGYFVAAQGLLLVAIFGSLLSGSLQAANAMKNVLVLGVNLMAAASFLIFAFDRIAWPAVAVIAVSSFVGGYLGSMFGKRLQPMVLRVVIVTLGLVALYFMIARMVTG